MKVRLLAFAVIGLLTICANAYATKPWSFAGIQLGVPLAESNLPACPIPRNSAALQGWAPPTAICVTGISGTAEGGQLADLNGLSALHWKEIYGGWISIWNDRVSSIRVHFGHDAFDDVRQILTVRYGKPVSTAQQQVISNGGASVTSAKYTWSESGNTIVLTERCQRIEWSCVDVMNDAMLQARIKAKDHSAMADASIL